MHTFNNEGPILQNGLIMAQKLYILFKYNQQYSQRIIDYASPIPTEDGRIAWSFLILQIRTRLNHDSTRTQLGTSRTVAATYNNISKSVHVR